MGMLRPGTMVVKMKSDDDVDGGGNGDDGDNDDTDDSNDSRNNDEVIVRCV